MPTTRSISLSKSYTPVMCKILLTILALVFLIPSCREEAVFHQSPSERTQTHLENFHRTLTSAPHGWKLTYFPRIDSLLFRNTTLRLGWTDIEPNKYGYGGYTILVKFKLDNKLELKVDLDTPTEAQPLVGEYSLSLGSSLQLSFTTYLPIHDLVTSELYGVSDFVYRYTDYLGNMILTTGGAESSNRPYVVLSPLPDEKSWQQAAILARDNRKFFEAMANPQILIRRGGRAFFHSDVSLRHPHGDTTREQERNRRRYHIFVADIDKYSHVFKGYNAIGSGYVGTETGLSFRPGFSYDDKTTFCDFERQGNKFVAELVSVYDPQLMKFRLVSKHLFPDGEPTNYTAEIIDTPLP